MSLKFGIYLVEQRIISPEQFCGLVKIQQEASSTAASLAIRKNILTIKQVAKLLDIVEGTPGSSFINEALAQNAINEHQAQQLLLAQQNSCPSITKLVIECGLLTQRQTTVLYHHFERGQNQVNRPAPATPQTTPAAPAPAKSTPRQPKFRKRPVIVRQLNQQR